MIQNRDIAPGVGPPRTMAASWMQICNEELAKLPEEWVESD